MIGCRTRRVDLTKAEEAAGFVNVETGLIGRQIFVDDEIYQLELQQIFGRCWLYLAHESQIPSPGDFVTVFMGAESVIVSRDDQGKINAFINSCRHRGVPVCRADQGNTRSFVCPYHSWTYDIRGNLTYVPGHENLYHGELRTAEWGLPKVAQVASYRGLVFGTLDPEAPSLEDYLGDMRWGLDLLLMQGDLVAVPGIARWGMDANWKLAADNAIGDMYHGYYTHRSAVLAGHKSGTGTAQRKARSRPPDNNSRAGFTVITKYGHGFNANYTNPEEVNFDTPIAAWRKNPQVQKNLGEMRSQVNRANMNVFPNLFVNSGSREVMLRNPLGSTRIEIWKTVLVDRNAPPEVQREQVRASNRHFGPAGMFEQDDGENWDQSTLGARAPITRQHDLNYAMAVGKGQIITGVDGKPPHVNTLYNEHAQLWFYRCWADFLTAPDWAHLKSNHIRPAGVI
jgi:phenylpropionate dioxygenase-like ring-hydroxylating dioxygenase large terminal subunit